jgi:hypothetical protein
MFYLTFTSTNEPLQILSIRVDPSSAEQLESLQHRSGDENKVLPKKVCIPRPHAEGSKDLSGPLRA